MEPSVTKLSSITPKMIEAIRERYNELDTLNLSDNAISAIQNLAPLNSLTSLDLSRNCIERLSNMADLKHLVTLDLASNQLHDLEGIQHCVLLHSLDLQNNPICRVATLEPLRGLPELHSLWLQGAPLASMPGYLAAVQVDLPQISLLDGAELRTMPLGLQTLTTPPLEPWSQHSSDKLLDRAEHQDKQTDGDLLVQGGIYGGQDESRCAVVGAGGVVAGLAPGNALTELQTLQHALAAHEEAQQLTEAEFVALEARLAESEGALAESEVRLAASEATAERLVACVSAATDNRKQEELAQHQQQHALQQLLSERAQLAEDLQRVQERSEQQARCNEASKGDLLRAQSKIAELLSALEAEQEATKSLHAYYDSKGSMDRASLDKSPELHRLVQERNLVDERCAALEQAVQECEGALTRGDRNDRELPLLTKWRHKAFENMFQLQVAQFAMEKEVAELQQRCADAEAAHARAASMERARTAEVQLQLSALNAAEAARGELQHRLDEQNRAAKELPALLKALQPSMDKLVGAEERLSELFDRVHFAVGRMEVAKALLMRKQNISLQNPPSATSNAGDATAEKAQEIAKTQAKEIFRLQRELEVLRDERNLLLEKVQEDPTAHHAQMSVVQHDAQEAMSALERRCDERIATLKCQVQELSIERDKMAAAQDIQQQNNEAVVGAAEEKLKASEQRLQTARRDAEGGQRELQQLRFEMASQQHSVEEAVHRAVQLKEETHRDAVQQVQQAHEEEISMLTQENSSLRREHAKVVITLRQLERDLERQTTLKNAEVDARVESLETQLHERSEQLRSVRKERDILLATNRELERKAQVRADTAESHVRVKVNVAEVDSPAVDPAVGSEQDGERSPVRWHAGLEIPETRPHMRAMPRTGEETWHASSQRSKQEHYANSEHSRSDVSDQRSTAAPHWATTMRDDSRQDDVGVDSHGTARMMSHGSSLPPHGDAFGISTASNLQQQGSKMSQLDELAALTQDLLSEDFDF